MNTRTDTDMSAVIVAAGRSSRLYPLTETVPKPLLQVAGEPMLARSVNMLRDAGIAKIHVVVGYLAEQIEACLGESVVYIHNPFYAYCNNMRSLWFARHSVAGRPFIYLHADLVYHRSLLDKMVQHTGTHASLLVDTGPADREAMKVRVEKGRFHSSSKDIPPDEAAGEWTGIAGFSSEGSRQLFETIDGLLAEGHLNDYDTLAFTFLARNGTDFSIVETANLPWIEIDDQADLDRARSLFPG